MVRPERRTKADIVVAAAIAVVVALAASLIWWNSDERATSSHPASVAATTPTSAREVPTVLNQLWTASSSATTAPVVAGGLVTTGSGRQVEGRDPATGQTRWTYARDTDLCGVSWIYRYAVAVYKDDRGCGQVTTIDGSSGRRAAARSSYADPTVHLSSDGTSVLSDGNTRLELWRSDLVRMLSYGETDARVKPVARGLHSGCTLESAAASSSTVSVLESCENQADLRLVILRPGKEDDEPQQRIVPEPVQRGSGARVLAVSDTSTLVYLSTPQPRIEAVDETGTAVASTLLPKAPSNASVVSKVGSVVTWWTGDTLMVFDASNLKERYTIAAGDTAVPLGPGVIMAGQLLVPVTGGMGLYAPVNGTDKGFIPVNRPASTLQAGKPVVPAVLGPRVFEQRGDTLV